MKIIDIAVNLTDDIFKGIYRGTSRHQNDFEQVLSRAIDSDVSKMIITGTDFRVSKDAIDLSRNFIMPNLYATVVYTS